MRGRAASRSCAVTTPPAARMSAASACARAPLNSQRTPWDATAAASVVTQHASSGHMGWGERGQGWGAVG